MCLPPALLEACRRVGIQPTRFLLLVSVKAQRTFVLQRRSWLDAPGRPPTYGLRDALLCSTSRFGTGQEQGSHRTPLGLHRVAAKIGGGFPIGTVFESRRPVGYVWRGLPDAGIVHRILWLEGLEPGFNRGGTVDSRARYIYIHGFSDETTLGRPASRGCIHLAAEALLPLYDLLPTGTLVWITERG